MRKNRLFTAESVSPGHPDSYMDYIVNSILDAYLTQDPDARVAIDGVVKNKYITLGGEITSTAKISDENIVNIIKRCTEEIGYEFEPEVTLHIYKQSPDIALGTNDDVGGAGDQGTITGYACQGPRNIPLEKALADEIINHTFMDIRLNHKFMKSDMKAQVTLKYDESGKPSVDTVVFACQHSEDCDDLELKDIITRSITWVFNEMKIPYTNCTYIINGTGKFIQGGPEADSGEVGRKIVVDAYGVSVPVGGGTYNGKDPSKVDRSAAYYSRYIAKNLVESGLVDECLITVSYCIGLADPISVDYDFFGTEHYDKDIILKVLDRVTDYRPKAMIKQLRLKRPIYAVSGLIGHYGLPRKLGLDFQTLVTIPWEQTDLVSAIHESLEFILHNEEEK